ncbi:hypothetical protein VTN96DRAFT_8216 [Rasamsonia emersonii]
MELPSFAPSEISRSTFSRLLACYPTTAREAFRQKAIAKAAKKRDNQLSKSERKAAAAAEKKKDSASAAAAAVAAASSQLPLPEAKLNKDTEAFVKLDNWRYERLPEVLRKRASLMKEKEKEKEKENEKGQSENENAKAKKEGPTGLYLEKDELVRLMEWKLKHGVYRPALEGLVKTNKAPQVRKTTAAAFAALPSAGSSSAPAEAPAAAAPAADAAGSSLFFFDDTSSASSFPKESLDTLTGPLRAVGPATASLILAAATTGTKNEVPFFSDEVYLWLCLDIYPLSANKSKKKIEKYIRANGELAVKYNLKEYRDLWEAVFQLRARLNSAVENSKAADGKKKKKDGDDDDVDDDGRIFSTADIEKVAYVLRHLDVSGFPGAAEILKQDKEREEEQAAAAEETNKEEEAKPRGKKRKRRDEEGTYPGEEEEDKEGKTGEEEERGEEEGGEDEEEGEEEGKEGRGR